MDAARALSLSSAISRLVGLDEIDDWEPDGPVARMKREVLARVVLALGDQDPLYVSGWAEDDEDPEGSLVALTATRLVRATFSVSRDPSSGSRRLDASVVAVSRELIQKVVVLKAGPLPNDPADPWPRAASVELHIKGEASPVTLPLAKRTVRPDSTTAAYASRFLGVDMTSAPIDLH